jgi:hypothetical protein
VGVASAFASDDTAAASNGNGTGPGLAARVPGSHLTHIPGAPTPPAGDARRRPEGVHDLLSRHERGKRDGRGKGA